MWEQELPSGSFRPDMMPASSDRRLLLMPLMANSRVHYWDVSKITGLRHRPKQIDGGKCRLFNLSRMLPLISMQVSFFQPLCKCCNCLCRPKSLTLFVRRLSSANNVVSGLPPLFISRLVNLRGGCDRQRQVGQSANCPIPQFQFPLK